MPDPTPFPELNAVLRELVSSVRTILAENFCGAYLQGSFAVGDADVHSDADFLVVTEDEVSPAQLDGLQTMHKRIYALDVFWAQHLEGSYVPRKSLRRLDPSRPPYLYLDNGSSELIWDNHCNTEVVRWSLREHRVILAGPEPKSLVDVVSADQLRREILATMREWATWAREPTRAGGMSQWKQTLLVLSYCRMLQTLAGGGLPRSERDANGRSKRSTQSGQVSFDVPWTIGRTRGNGCTCPWTRIKPSAPWPLSITH